MSHAGLGYPASSATASTWNVLFRSRENENAGSYATSPYVASLVIAFPGGYNDIMSYDFLKEILIQHVLNSDIVGWWSPKIGTVEDGLRAVFDILPFSRGTTQWTSVFFNGQAGPVLCG